jgi:hypothetical protein
MTPEVRKAHPLFSGLLRYFPKALMAVSHCSWVGNEQHNPGEPLHWNRSKSTDEPDALMRHLVDAGTIDTDGVRHSTKVAWRALAMLEKELEAAAAANAPLPSEFKHCTVCNLPYQHADTCPFDGTPLS